MRNFEKIENIRRKSKKEQEKYYEIPKNTTGINKILIDVPKFV